LDEWVHSPFAVFILFFFPLFCFFYLPLSPHLPRCICCRSRFPMRCICGSFPAFLSAFHRAVDFYSGSPPSLFLLLDLLCTLHYSISSSHLSLRYYFTHFCTLPLSISSPGLLKRYVKFCKSSNSLRCSPLNGYLPRFLEEHLCECPGLEPAGDTFLSPLFPDVGPSIPLTRPSGSIIRVGLYPSIVSPRGHPMLDLIRLLFKRRWQSFTLMTF